MRSLYPLLYIASPHICGETNTNKGNSLKKLHHNFEIKKKKKVIKK